MRVEVIGASLIGIGAIFQGATLYQGTFHDNWESAVDGIVAGTVLEGFGLLSVTSERKKEMPLFAS